MSGSQRTQYVNTGRRRVSTRGLFLDVGLRKTHAYVTGFVDTFASHVRRITRVRVDESYFDGSRPCRSVMCQPFSALCIADVFTGLVQEYRFSIAGSAVPHTGAGVPSQLTAEPTVPGHHADTRARLFLVKVPTTLCQILPSFVMIEALSWLTIGSRAVVPVPNQAYSRRSIFHITGAREISS